MHTAFVLSGGGSLGAVQVGMLQALADHRLGPDLLVGASAGALNAAYVAGHGFTHDTPRPARRCVARPASTRGSSRSCLTATSSPLLGARPSLCAADGLHRLVRDNLTYDRLERATIPIQIIATDVISGTEVVPRPWRPGLRRSSVPAAIPAVFPTVTIDGHVLFDGGVADNTPISQAVAAGAERVVVLPAGVGLRSTPRLLARRSRRVHALTLLIEQRLMLDVAAYHDQVDLVVLPPLCPLTIAAVRLPARRIADRSGPFRHHPLARRRQPPAPTPRTVPPAASPCPLQERRPRHRRCSERRSRPAGSTLHGIVPAPPSPIESFGCVAGTFGSDPRIARERMLDAWQVTVAVAGLAGTPPHDPEAPHRCRLAAVAEGATARNAADETWLSEQFCVP